MPKQILRAKFKSKNNKKPNSKPIKSNTAKTDKTNRTPEQLDMSLSAIRANLR